MNIRMNRKNTFDEDSRLSTPSQLAIKSLVAAIPDEEVSLAWRSSLNQKLMLEVAKKQRRRHMFWIASPIAGLSVAAALAFVVMFHPVSHHAAPKTDLSLEAAIVADHHKEVLETDLSSAGLNGAEVATEANVSDPDQGVWSESDVESL